jgi:hypothetical protein
MDKLFNLADRYPGRTMATIMIANIALFIGAVAVIAVAVRYVVAGTVCSSQCRLLAKTSIAASTVSATIRTR